MQTKVIKIDSADIDKEAMKEAAATLMQMVLDGVAQKSDGEEAAAD